MILKLQKIFEEKMMNEFPLLNPNEGIPLFYPFIPPNALEEIKNTLSSRWIGQGPKVDKFEKKFKSFIGTQSEMIATGSGTDSLHLSYLLAGIKSGDEVLTPVFTCTATTLPLLYIGAKPVFVDIEKESMNICISDIKKKITKKTKAIISVDYGGIPVSYKKIREIANKFNLKYISDAAQSVGTLYEGKSICDYADFTAFSFQAIKTITTADGGMLAIKDKNLIEKAKRLRWFGIDRSSKQLGKWENDIKEIGFKYQMTDLSASLGLSSLPYLDQIIEHRRELLNCYVESINHPLVKVIFLDELKGNKNSPWLCTILVQKDRIGLMKKLRHNKIESAQVHYRNDRYTIFGGRQKDLKNMDFLEDKYLVLPLHFNINIEIVKKICSVINSGW